MFTILHLLAMSYSSNKTLFSHPQDNDEPCTCFLHSRFPAFLGMFQEISPAWDLCGNLHWLGTTCQSCATINLLPRAYLNIEEAQCVWYIYKHYIYYFCNKCDSSRLSARVGLILATPGSDNLNSGICGHG